MATTTAAPVGRTLDRLVDDVLAQSPVQADWTAVARMLVPNQHVMAGDPFARLFKSNFGSRAVAAIGNESQSLSAVGTYAANALGALLRRVPSGKGFGRLLPPNAKMLAVFHGDKGLRVSILILDPALDANSPASLAPSAWIDDLTRAAPNLFDKSPLNTALPAFDSDDTIQALWIARPRIVVAPAPKMIDTCVRRPAGKVTCGGKTSAVGAYARDSSGRPGVTVCYHGTGGVGTELSIDNVPRTVTSASQVLDTCFVAMSEQDMPPPPLLASKGLLMSRAPGGQEHHTFWSQASSVTKEARIIGTDLGLPEPTPQRQLCLYTDPVTNYSDSGGALVNDDDQLVGFSFQRTPFGNSFEYSTWIWAHSAFDELNLKPLAGGTRK